MKKFLSFVLAVVLGISLFGCARNNVNITLGDGIRANNSDDRFDTSIYLTKDKFYFTNYNDKASFGDCNTLYVLDLKTGKTEQMLDFDAGDVKNIKMIGDYLYFTCYTYTSFDTDANWGSCLLKYNVQNGECSTVFETPNTVQDIMYEDLGDKLVILGGCDEQENAGTKYELNLYDTKTEKIQKIEKYSSIVPNYMETDGRNVYLRYERGSLNSVGNAEILGNVTISISQKGEIKECKHEFAEDYDDTKGPDMIDGMVISAKFGDYSILQDKISEKKSLNGCGFEYKIKYYIYDGNTWEKTPLTTAKYWFYYV